MSDLNRLPCYAILMEGKSELLSYDSPHHEIHRPHGHIDYLTYISVN